MNNIISLKSGPMNKNHIDKHKLSVIHNHIFYNLPNSFYSV